MIVPTYLLSYIYLHSTAIKSFLKVLCRTLNLVYMVSWCPPGLTLMAQMPLSILYFCGTWGPPTLYLRTSSKNQRLYAEKDAEKQLPTNPLNAATIQGGYIAGDNALRAYVAAQKMNDNEKFLVCAIIMREVKRGSQAEVILTRACVAIATHKTHYRSRTFRVLLSLIKIRRSSETTFDFITCSTWMSEECRV